MKYLIKNKKYKTYYSKTILTFYHFIKDPKSAHQFNTRYEAKKVLQKFNKKDNFEIVSMKQEDK